METLILAVTSLAGWGLAVLVYRTSRKELAEQREAHAGQTQQLIDQIQLNSQSMPYYPTLGPFEAPVEAKRYLASDDGLIVFEDLELDALEEVAG